MCRKSHYEMSNPIFPPLFDDEDPGEWPGDEWPRFLEILRVFCLSDAEQDEYFPDLKEPHYHSAMGGDGYTLSSYDPPMADAHDLCGAYLVRCEKSQDEMFHRLAALFYESVYAILEPVETREFLHAPKTDLAELKIIRPKLRALCTEALDFFGAEKRAPQMPWDEIAPQ